MAFTESLQVEAAAPFNFDLTAQIFRNGDEQIRTFQDGIFRLILKLNDHLILAEVSSVGTTEQPKLAVQLRANNSLTSGDKQKAEEAVRFIFNLDFDLCSFYRNINGDRVMSGIAKQLYGLKNPTTPTVFESLVDSIIEQQISIKVAIALEEKLIKKFGERLDIGDETYFAFPTPQIIAVASVEEIQRVGLSRRKAEYIHGAAELIVAGKLDLEGLKSQENADEIVRKLDAVRGIGVWTAELTMLRGMQRLDMLPADDLGIRRVISTYYCGGKPINASEAREIALRWGRWKGLAAFYLIIAEIRGIAIKEK
ncbi:MAG: DNA-3-methyladenine glycosylase [Candidatus Bathyarchaeia archaeon]|jgi:DNA-3-methyladenine glycosylase II